MSQSQDQTVADLLASTPDLHIGNLASFLCKKMSVPGVIVMLSNEDGTIGMTGHGVNHFRANEMLSVGIHINMSQHDELVRAGAAGAEAKDRQAEIDSNAANVAATTEA